MQNLFDWERNVLYITTRVGVPGKSFAYIIGTYQKLTTAYNILIEHLNTLHSSSTKRLPIPQLKTTPRKLMLIHHHEPAVNVAKVLDAHDTNPDPISSIRTHPSLFVPSSPTI